MCIYMYVCVHICIFKCLVGVCAYHITCVKIKEQLVGALSLYQLSPRTELWLWLSGFVAGAFPYHEPSLLPKECVSF